MWPWTSLFSPLRLSFPSIKLVWWASPGTFLVLSFVILSPRSQKKDFKFISSLFGLSIHCSQRNRQSRLECFDLQSNFSYLKSCQNKVYYVSKSRLDRLLREWGAEGLSFYLKEAGIPQLMATWSSGLKVSNLVFSINVPSTTW